MTLIQMLPYHFEDFCRITRAAEPWWEHDDETLWAIFRGRMGFMVLNRQGEIVGHITFSDFIPKASALLHCSILPEYHSKWLTKSIYKQVFDYVFDILEVHICNALAYEGLTNPDVPLRLGFKKDGILRESLHNHGKYYNVHWYSMLANERRW